MSSTNKTENYNLNQWVSTDYVMMSDFNADNAAIDEALADKANVCSGTYTGTGTAGSANPVSLNFDFTPAIVAVTGPGGKTGEAHEVCAVFIRNHTAGGYTTVKDGTAQSIELACSWNGTALSFYSTDSSALEQLNAQGESYGYAALGV